jgi:tRNA (guanine-N7-)-methyltransferase
VPRLPLEDLARYLLAVPDPPAPIDWQVLFGNDQPVELEVGFGKGLFLINAATAHPGVNYAGVEIERKYQLFTATRLAKRGLGNVCLACADGRRFLRDCVSAGSLRAVHVYFPDPWWKKRHHKRRVFTAEFAADCCRVLRPGGQLHVATDVEEYFGLIRQAVAPLASLTPVPVGEAPRPAESFRTNFERKALERGGTVYQARYERLP